MLYISSSFVWLGCSRSPAKLDYHWFSFEHKTIYKILQNHKEHISHTFSLLPSGSGTTRILANDIFFHSIQTFMQNEKVLLLLKDANQSTMCDFNRRKCQKSLPSHPSFL